MIDCRSRVWPNLDSHIVQGLIVGLVVSIDYTTKGFRRVISSPNETITANYTMAAPIPNRSSSETLLWAIVRFHSSDSVDFFYRSLSRNFGCLV